MGWKKRVSRGVAALLVATVLWIPTLHLFFMHGPREFRSAKGLSPKAEQMAARHLSIWTDPVSREKEFGKMRSSNAEWDFMGRTFLVWSLADMSLRNPTGKQEYLGVMDRIIEETIRLEKERGMYFFLMSYAKAGEYVMQPPRSLFLDGEIAMMLASRRLVEEKAEYAPLMRERLEFMISRMGKGEVLSAESYPDECWMFDNTLALAAMRMADKLDGTDHSEFLRHWLKMARERLIDKNSGLLVSSYTVNGDILDGPEGSSIWMVTHCLRLVDEDFGKDQYQRARRELGRGLAGFAWSREWPVSWTGPMDIDSGAVIPVLEISAGGSGMAFIGASSFGDDDYLTALAATLDFSAFPSRTGGRLKYCASNQVGDAALLYAAVLGPLWDKVKGVKP